MYANYIKHLISLFFSVLALLLLWPIMILIVMLIRLESSGNPIFKQIRLGRKQKEFTVYKFRTMVENAYDIGGATSYDGDPRITKVGAFLRKTSIDELPQLINILRGDMSIIGPRPILKEEFEPYKTNSYYAKRYDVLPGLFCTVDVDYRASAARQIQFKMDAEYVDNISFGLDAKVFAKTFIAVMRRKNIYKS